MTGTLPTNGGYAGQAWVNTGGSEFGAIDFLVRQILAGKAFSALVVVRGVTGGGLGKPATVSVQPLVNQVDGLGNQIPHGTIYGIPCFRLQGGTSAVIIDPAIGDIGQAIICDRDISNVKATGVVSGPGSFRRNDWADGCYFGGVLNAAPTQYVQFTAGGINIISPGTITIHAAGGTTIDGKPFLPHEHTAPSGGGTTSGVL